jgi:nitronate monooxygenase
VPPLYRRALKNLQDDQTALTNIFTGRAARAAINRIARELGPMDKYGSTFPVASAALAPLRAKSEAAGLYDFTPIWSGQAACLGRARSWAPRSGGLPVLIGPLSPSNSRAVHPHSTHQGVHQ